MIPLFFIMIVMTFSVLGYGYILFNNLFPDLKGTSYYNLGFLGLIGLIFFYVLSIYINFLFPITAQLVTVFNILGLILFFINRAKILSLISFDEKILYLILSMSLCFTVTNTSLTTYGDAGLYHIPNIHWINESKMVFGLTNLNLQFGLVSSWHSVGSLFSLPFVGIHGTFILNSVLFIFVISFFIAQIKQKFDMFFSAICSLFVLSLFIGLPNSYILNYLSTPTPDFAVTLYSIVLFYIYIILIAQPEKNQKSSLNLVLSLTTFIISLKFSQIYQVFYLVLITPLLIKNFKNLFHIIFISFLLALPIVIKSFLYSSCFLYPINQTCLNTSWYPSTSITIINEIYSSSNSIFSAVKNYFISENSDSIRNWFTVWLSKGTSNIYLLILITLCILTIIILSVLKRFIFNNKVNKFIYLFLLISFFDLLLIAQMIHFFDVRYFIGLIFIITFSSIFLLISLIKTNFKLNHIYLKPCYTALVLCIIFKYTYAGFVGDIKFLDKIYALPKLIPPYNVSYVKTKNNIEISTVDYLQRYRVNPYFKNLGWPSQTPDDARIYNACWEAPLPCIAYKENAQNLVIEKKYSYLFIKEEK